MKVITNYTAQAGGQSVMVTNAQTWSPTFLSTSVTNTDFNLSNFKK